MKVDHSNFKFNPAAFAADLMYFYPVCEKELFREHLSACSVCGKEHTDELRHVAIAAGDNWLVIYSLCEEHQGKPPALGADLPSNCNILIDDDNAAGIWSDCIDVAVSIAANDVGLPVILQGIRCFWKNHETPDNMAVLFNEEGIHPIYWANNGTHNTVSGVAVREAEGMDKEIRSGAVKARIVMGMLMCETSDPDSARRISANIDAGQRRAPKGKSFSLRRTA